MTPEKYAEIKSRHDAWVAEKNRKPWSPTDPQALRAINNYFTYALDDLSAVIQRLDELEAKVRSCDEDRAAWDQTAEKMESLMRGLVQSREEHREDARKHREDALAWMQASYALFKERNEARAEMDEFALTVGYGERPEGQSGVHRLHGEQLADRWKQIEKERDEARYEVERLNQLNSSLSEELQRLYQREARGLADWGDLRAEFHRQRLEIQSHDCGYGETGPGLIHCPIDKPCTVHQLERLREVVRKVHGLVNGVKMIALPAAVHMLAEIHKLTKGEE